MDSAKYSVTVTVSKALTRSRAASLAPSTPAGIVTDGRLPNVSFRRVSGRTAAPPALRAMVAPEILSGWSP